MTSYHGRTVLLTGASRGIGEAMARQLARDGARLLLVARSEDDLDRLADEFRSLGAEAEVFAHDLGTAGAAQALFDRVTDAGHTVDVLINNAGFGKLGAFADYDAGVYEAMVTLNVTNLVVLTRLVLPGMVERRTGGILNVASTAAYTPVPGFAVYAASKSFVLSFTEALHAELEDTGIAVTALSPGPTSTGFFDAADMDGVPGGRPAETPEKVARVGLEALLANERSTVSGRLNQVTTFATRFAPKKVLLSAAKRMMQQS